MAKLKTHKGVEKRMKVTGAGRLVRFKAGRRHLLTGKPSDKTRRLRGSAGLSAADEAKVRRLIPYS
jgi:large subunit ribosomal protein L35